MRTRAGGTGDPRRGTSPYNRRQAGHLHRTSAPAAARTNSPLCGSDDPRWTMIACPPAKNSPSCTPRDGNRIAVPHLKRTVPQPPAAAVAPSPEPGPAKTPWHCCHPTPSPPTAHRPAAGPPQIRPPPAIIPFNRGPGPSIRTPMSSAELACQTLTGTAPRHSGHLERRDPSRPCPAPPGRASEPQKTPEIVRLSGSGNTENSPTPSLSLNRISEMGPLQKLRHWEGAVIPRRQEHPGSGLE